MYIYTVIACNGGAADINILHLGTYSTARKALNAAYNYAKDSVQVKYQILDLSGYSMGSFHKESKDTILVMRTSLELENPMGFSTLTYEGNETCIFIAIASSLCHLLSLYGEIETSYY